MKNDAELQKDVIDELRWDPSVPEKEVGVAVKAGVVTLSGFVESYAQKYAATRAAERVSGVRAVADELTVRLPSVFARSDTQVAHAVVDALRWDVQVPDEKVKSRVADGWVTLEGEVEWQFEKDAAARAIRNLTGVRGVTNLIKVMPKRVSSFDVSAKIKDALRRGAEHDAEQIVVEAKEGKVTLKGTVRSYAEKEDAERAAWAAPGVVDVVDELAIKT